MVVWWLLQNNNLQDGLFLGACQGWGSLHGVCDHPASLLLLCCKWGFGHIFPTSPCLKQWKRSGFVGAGRPPECSCWRRRSTSLIIPGQQHKPWVSSWSFVPALHPLSPLNSSNFRCTSCAPLARGVPGLPLTGCTSKASPACLLFPAPPAACLPGLTHRLTPLSNREDNISSPQGSAHIL